VRRVWLAGFLTLYLSGCDYLPWYPEGREDPVAVARGFIAAARRGDCKDAWSYFSEQTREKLRQQSQRAIRSAPYDSLIFAPYRIQCTPFKSYRPSTVKLGSSTSAHATIEVMEQVPDPESFSLSGWSPRRMDAKRSLELVREPDGWTVLPPVPVDERPERSNLIRAAVPPRNQANQ
jgi:hypothetical protein